MNDAILGENNIATMAGDITVYNYDKTTREYIGRSVEYLPLGVGIPASSCTDAPPKNKEGFAICRNADLSDWMYVADHRGDIVYDTMTGQSSVIGALGDYADGVTTLPPTTTYDIWNGSEWVTDADAQQAAAIAAAEGQKVQLRYTADSEIAWRQDAVNSGIATEEETTALDEWKKYRVRLMRIDASKAPDIEWPILPGQNQ